MRLAYLRAGWTPEPLRAAHGDYLDMFDALFREARCPLELVPFEVREGSFPQHPDDFDGYLLCGAAESVFDPLPWIGELIRFCRHLERSSAKPLVGICFGHQMIAHALGGQVARAASGWGIGARRAELLHRQDWMPTPFAPPTLLYSHQDQVLQGPPGSTRIAAAAHCPWAMLSHDNRFLGIQGHPEFTPAYAAALMESRRQRIGSALVDEAMATLSAPVDRLAVAAAMVSFLSRLR